MACPGFLRVADINGDVGATRGCATECSPHVSDLGDSECFIYLQGTNSFLSSDKRWVRIARKVCPNNVFDPENKVPQ